MLDYKLLEAFAAVLDEGGFERAARKLHLTQSAVSQRVRLLEERLGQALVVRSSPVRPTEEGRRLLQHYRQVESLEADLLGSLATGGAEAPVVVPLAINTDTISTWFVSALAPLLSSSNLLLDVFVADQEETQHLLRDGRVVGCVSSRSTPLHGCRCEYLGHMNYYCCAAPAFAARWFPRGLTAEAARAAPVLRFHRNDRLHQHVLEPLGVSADEVPTHYLPDSAAFIAACLYGVAYAMMPDVQAEEYLRAGTLVDLAPGQLVRVGLYWHHWNLHTELLTRLSAAFHAQASVSLRVEGGAERAGSGRPAARGRRRSTAA